MPKKVVEKEKPSLTKVVTTIGAIATVITALGGLGKVYLEVVNSKLQVVESLAKTRSIMIDDFKVRRDQANHQAEFLNLKLGQDPQNRDLRDELLIQRDIGDSLNRLIERATSNEK